jgi:hypothetical protein
MKGIQSEKNLYASNDSWEIADDSRIKRNPESLSNWEAIWLVDLKWKDQGGNHFDIPSMKRPVKEFDRKFDIPKLFI